MSKYMQIEIRISPFFEKPFQKQFPNISDLFRRMSYREAIQEERSLYALTDYLVSLYRDPKTPVEMKNRLLPHVRKIRALKDQAREKFLVRDLNGLDQLLYQIEDGFEELEASL